MKIKEFVLKMFTAWNVFSAKHPFLAGIAFGSVMVGFFFLFLRIVK